MPVDTAEAINVHDLVDETLKRTDELLTDLKPALATIKEILDKEKSQPPRVVYTEEQRANIRRQNRT